MPALDLTVDWKAAYASKLVSAEQAAATFESGDHLWIPPGHSAPEVLTALAARQDELEGVEIRGILIPEAGWYETPMSESFAVAPQFGSLLDRDAVNAGIVDYHPYWLVGIHKAYDAGRGEGEAWQIDKSFVTVSAPNERGWVNCGGNLWDSVTTARRAKTVIAEMSESVIFAEGDGWLHVSELDYIMPTDRDVMLLRENPPTDPADAGLSHYVGEIVQDGDTIQVGVGQHTREVVLLGALDDKQELSYFGELTVEGCVTLAERGVITGRQSALHPGEFTATVIGNTPEERNVIAGNPYYQMRSVEYLLDPSVIARQENFVAINGALRVDLSGQKGVHTLGPKVVAGVGGHLAFAMGAYLCPTGRYVCVMPSTALGGTVSNIVPRFEEGQIVTVPRELSDTVVTEFGIARLLGKTVRQRADELIAVAHPDFRAELRNAAKSFFYPDGHSSGPAAFPPK
jgi:4-hydroxybutyrate CoA-transferase